GGGVIEALADEMLPTIEKSAARVAFEYSMKGVRIVRAELGDDAGVIGAAIIASERFESQISRQQPEAASEAGRGRPNDETGPGRRTTMKVIGLFRRDPAEVDLARTYDAVIIGSGAAGGMASHVLTSRGMKVLLLEAGKKLNIEEELKSTEWPYDHPRRGAMPPGYHALGYNEDSIRHPPYAQNTSYKHVLSYIHTSAAPHHTKTMVVDEKDHPYTGTDYAWVRARLLGGKTNIWGRLALRL